MHYTSLASSMNTIWRALESYGCNPRALFEQAGLDPQKLYRPNARYLDSKIYRLWKLAIKETGDPGFGLSVAEYWHPSNAHALGFAWLASETLLDAFERLVRYARLLTDKENVELQTSNKEVKFIVNNPAIDCPTADEDNDCGFAVILNLCRLSCGPEFNPLRIEMQRPEPIDKSRYEQLFRAPIEYYATQNSFVFNKIDMLRPLPTSNSQLALANDQIIIDYLARYERSNLSMQTRAKLIEHLASGKASQQTIADSLNMSLRNFQRNLKNEGTGYKTMLEDVRRELALQYMQQTEMSINEITYMLGFSEPANFSRAFKRWTGVSPTDFRATTIN